MCGRVWQSRSNLQLQSTMTSLGINEVRQTDEHTGTYCHEFRAGSDKLSETEQEIFLCGKNLSQLQEDEETHTFILSHTLLKVTLWSWISSFWFFLFSHLSHFNSPVSVLVKIGHELLQLFFERSMWRILHVNHTRVKTFKVMQTLI